MMDGEWTEWLGKKRRSLPLYPQIDLAIRGKGTMPDFFDAVGISSTSYYKMQRGSSVPTKNTIDAILNYTGLTYEKAFRKD